MNFLFSGKTWAIAILLVSIGVGVALLTDPNIDFRVKMLHCLFKGIFTVSTILGVSSFEVLNFIIPTVPPGLGEDGITSVDLVIPHSPRSVFEGTTPLEDVNVRVYFRAEDEEKLPILINFHGGGFAIGSAAQTMYDSPSRKFAIDGPMLVISVDYRLTPKYPLPAAIDDCVAAVLWAHAATHPLVQQHGDPSKIILMGDSAGGNLAAVVAQVLVKCKGFNIFKKKKNEIHLFFFFFLRVLLAYPEVKVIHQILIYPSLHLSVSQMTESHKKHANGYMLFESARDAFEKALLGNNEKELILSHLNQPLLASSFSNLPPGQIVVAGLDMLSDEGILYFKALKNAGVDVTQLSFSLA